MPIYPQQLKCGIGGPNPTRFPVTNGADTDVEKARRLLSGESTEDSGVSELSVADNGTMRRFV